MRHEIQRAEEGKNRHKKVAARRKLRAETDPRSTDTPTDLLIEEIDPADFFDPEEFGYRRGVHYSG